MTGLARPSCRPVSATTAMSPSHELTAVKGSCVCVCVCVCVLYVKEFIRDLRSAIYCFKTLNDVGLEDVSTSPTRVTCYTRDIPPDSTASDINL